MMAQLSESEILFEDNHLLVVNKPAGILTMGDDTGDETMADWASQYLKEKYQKPGNVFVGIVHRLDRPVSGVLILTRTSKAAGRLSDQFRQSKVQKEYRAIVEGTPQPPFATLHDILLKDQRTNTSRVVGSTDSGGKPCELNYETIDDRGNRSSLRVLPKTGRSHQIRVQLAHCGHPIVGDTRYGSSVKTGGRIFLHAHRIEILHPTLKTAMTFEAAIPDAMRNG